jgi:hypothetical protein
MTQDDVTRIAQAVVQDVFPDDNAPAAPSLAADLAGAMFRDCGVLIGTDAATALIRAGWRSPQAAEQYPALWTPERLELLQRVYSSALPVAEIVARLNELPGKRIVSRQQVTMRAYRMGLSRREPEPADNAAPSAPRERVKYIYPYVAPAALSDEDRAEARKMIREGKKPAELADWFGGTRAWWSEWKARIRKEHARKAAKERGRHE